MTALHYAKVIAIFIGWLAIGFFNAGLMIKCEFIRSPDEVPRDDTCWAYLYVMAGPAGIIATIFIVMLCCLVWLAEKGIDFVHRSKRRTNFFILVAAIIAAPFRLIARFSRWTMSGYGTH